MFRVIMVGGPVRDWIIRCVDSLKSQTVTDWTAAIVLDPCDDSADVVADHLDERFVLRLNETRQYGLKNTADAIELLEPDPEDILVTLDLDDWLTDDKSLEVVLRAYESQPGLLMTYGSWVSHPDPNALTNTGHPYSEAEFNDIRHSSFKASHLRSFKYKLWAKIDQERSFIDPKGMYYQAATDLSFMWPMMEMAGYDRVKWIPQRIYTHNQARTHGDSLQFGWEQCRNTDHQASLRPYERVDF